MKPPTNALNRPPQTQEVSSPALALSADPAQFFVRPLTLNDLEILCHYEQCYFFNPWSQNSLNSRLESSHLSINLGISLENHPELMGYLLSTFVEQEATLEKIAVRAEYRQCGLGSRLIYSWIQHLKSHPSIHFLFLEVRAKDSGARRFYEKLGFYQQAIRRHYYCGPDQRLEDAILLSGTLPTVERILLKKFGLNANDPGQIEEKPLKRL